MTNNDVLPVQSDSQSKPKQSSFTFGGVGWIFVFGLAVLAIGILTETGYLSTKFLNRICYLIDPRYWSLLLSPVLWGLVFWIFVDFLSYFNFVRKCRFVIRFIILSAAICVGMILHGWTSADLRILIYYNIYVDFIVGPASNLMAGGKWDWKTFVVPVTAIVTIALLLYIAKKNRRPKS
ncbi:MAG: hypothetical protein LBQ66_00815 [Planctomycetaceae bacterium]|jgi:hypothetical protein|nr:hypothetical protein [Planctomycetaceae bacterium]